MQVKMNALCYSALLICTNAVQLTWCWSAPPPGVQEEADRGAAAGRAAAAAAAAGARLPGIAAAAAGSAAAAAAGQEAAVPLQRPGAREQRQTRLGQRGEATPLWRRAVGM